MQSAQQESTTQHTLKDSLKLIYRRPVERVLAELQRLFLFHFQGF
jgi:hypothetical protein